MASFQGAFAGAALNFVEFAIPPQTEIGDWLVVCAGAINPTGDGSPPSAQIISNLSIAVDIHQSVNTTQLGLSIGDTHITQAVNLNGVIRCSAGRADFWAHL